MTLNILIAKEIHLYTPEIPKWYSEILYKLRNSKIFLIIEIMFVMRFSFFFGGGDT